LRKLKNKETTRNNQVLRFQKGKEEKKFEPAEKGNDKGRLCKGKILLGAWKDTPGGRNHPLGGGGGRTRIRCRGGGSYVVTGGARQA